MLGYPSYEKSYAHITVRYIFEDNDNWARYRFHHEDELREVEIKEVEKMLRCHDDGRGFFAYQCPKCKKSWVVSNGCNSRLCSECGKRYSDKWAKGLSGKMFNVVHRHLVLTVPDIVWSILRGHKDGLKTFMDAGIKAINATLSYTSRKLIEKGGAIVVLHSYGKEIDFHPHLHVLVTEGGFNKFKKFVRKKTISYKAMRKTWQYHLLTELKKFLPKSKKYARLIDACFKKYSNGFYIYMPPKNRIRSKRKVANYVGRYIRHPAIANTRISGYDGREVTFWHYKDEGKREKVFVTIPVEEFMRRVIQHVPETQFKMIRYYGAYCRKWKRKYQRYILLGSITQSKITSYPRKRCYRCPNCGTNLEFDFKLDKPPPDDRKFGEFIDDWSNLSWGKGSYA